MGLLDSVIGALGQRAGAAGGGGNAALLNAVLGMLAGGGQQAGAGAAGGLGGLGALLEQFQRNGMGEVANSWVGTGPNLPISPEQLGTALGADTLSQMASQTGMGQSDLLGQLSQMLPQVVDKVTPNGQLPQAGPGGPDLGALLGSLLGR
ncbi:MAG TPA: YidB family protein [Rubrivivax sp.]